MAGFKPGTVTDFFFYIQVRAFDWWNGWEQEKSGVKENQHWAVEETSRAWHWHHLLHWLVPPHVCNLRKLTQYWGYCFAISCFPTPPLSPGPEFETEGGCIFIGMVTEDIDVTELVDTIASLGRDIEDNGKVLAIFILCHTVSPLISLNLIASPFNWC